MGDDLSPLARRILAAYRKGEFQESEPDMAVLVDDGRNKADIRDVIRVVEEAGLTRPHRRYAKYLSVYELEEINNITLGQLSDTIRKDKVPDPFHPWIRTVANRRAIDQLKKNGRYGEMIKAEGNQVEYRQRTRLTDASRVALVADLQRAKMKLTTSVRGVFSAWEKQPDNQARVARSMGMPTRRFYTLLTRAKEQMRGMLGPGYRE